MEYIYMIGERYELWHVEYGTGRYGIYIYIYRERERENNDEGIGNSEQCIW